MEKLDIPVGARLASRVMIIDERNRILLCRGEEPKSGSSFWVMPGGGLDSGESFEEAAVREVYEETGLQIQLGPCIWHRRHLHMWNGKSADQFEKFFVSWVTHTPDISGESPDSYIKEHRWWGREEIEASDEKFAPRKLGQLLPSILSGDLPAAPLDCGV